MSDQKIPPKIVGLQARQSNTEELAVRESHTPTKRAGGLPASVTGLPVLEAFQRFLDAERRRTRNRMMVLTALFVLVLIIAGAVSVIVGARLFRNTEKEIQGVQEHVAAIENETHGLRDEARSMINRAAASLQKKHLALARTSKAQLEQHDDNIGRMQMQVRELEAQNTVLNYELDSVREILPSLSTDLRLVVNLMEDMRPMEPELVDPLLSAPESITMLIRPQGLDEEIPWRLPIPE